MDTIFMNIVLDPLIAFLGVVVPIGLAYIILLLQSRKPCSGDRRTSASACNELLQKRTKESCAEENRAAP